MEGWLFRSMTTCGRNVAKSASFSLISREVLSPNPSLPKRRSVKVAILVVPLSASGTAKVYVAGLARLALYQGAFVRIGPGFPSGYVGLLRLPKSLGLSMTVNELKDSVTLSLDRAIA